jgi:mannosyltransferase OCH1-like enzyme
MQNTLPKAVLQQLHESVQNNSFKTFIQPKNTISQFLHPKKKIKAKRKKNIPLFQHPNKTKKNETLQNETLQNETQQKETLTIHQPNLPTFHRHLKDNYQSIIPLKIFQTWHTKNLPKHMHDCVEQLKRQNPEFEHHLFDDQDCRDFIKKNFPDKVLRAYEKIIPGSYKADLWRYCVLYIEGGIYLDIKFHCTNGFKLISLTENEHFVNDIPRGPLRFPDYRNEGIFNAFMVALPGNQKFKKCIDAIVHHTQIHFYGGNALSPTGPFLLRRFFTPDERKDIKMRFFGYRNLKPRGIHFKGIKILDIYPQYRNEQKRFSKTVYYGDLWLRRNIYR